MRPVTPWSRRLSRELADLNGSTETLPAVCESERRSSHVIREWCMLELESPVNDDTVAVVFPPEGMSSDMAL